MDRKNGVSDAPYVSNTSQGFGSGRGQNTGHLADSCEERKRW